uniref:DUF4258 domain-containing protein n=1 Tax=Candidatus Kentrum sp. TUN TaxID=2126343 RepID=A0A450ZTZ8_9GAMM|nr:MAG: hypothetical protein BECKTUN1418D_GA0071000_10086 [Candidatus Kentron sp. TUN]VFK57251.1 MAG: hypothetical protein BECKTUN1418F_GA0071002_11106 [Candidatus Kentron sp. TUN]VFK65365.1 MAG: hypothetical protein BECKTUN1418E_GA0071001_11066 [Candidatus Kentron sp. TUN]
MKIRYYMDPQTGLPHIHGHAVDEDEVREAMLRSVEDRLGKDGSRVTIGGTSGGRYLKVVYVPDLESDSVFVITAYELRGKPLSAFRHRSRRKLL